MRAEGSIRGGIMLGKPTIRLHILRQSGLSMRQRVTPLGLLHHMPRQLIVHVPPVVIERLIFRADIPLCDGGLVLL